MIRFRLIRCLLFFSMILISFQSFCGWIISEKSRDEKGNSKLQTIRVQNNRIRFDDESTLTVLDLDKQLVIIAFKGKKIYWSGSLQEFRDGISGAFQKQMQYLIDNAPEDQRYYFENLFRNYLKAVNQQPGEQTAKIKIGKNDSTFVIKGFKTNKYDIYLNDTLKETLWVTGQINPYAGINLEKLIDFNKQLSPFDEHNNYALTVEYLDLLKKGMPVRSVIYYPDNSKMITEVEEIQNTDISAKNFSPPKDYRKVDLEELLNWIAG
ncbi:MAG: DUF4412 domain-containing protein [Chlorobi bacterium]|nr:DUF4412 domain-containing protein [Chlorobiota bacterium]